MPKSDFDGNDIELSKRAADGDLAARVIVNKLSHPIISFQTEKFCRRFCNENKYMYSCTLPEKWGKAPVNAILCEWGNASYAWMLDDLTNTKRLTKFEARDGSSLGNYLFYIANSIPFYERWKDWRFGRRVHVPIYIQDIGPESGHIFLAMRSGDNTALIAQKLAKSENDISIIAQQIIIELTKRNRLHLLNPPKTVSLTGMQNDEDNNAIEADIALSDMSPEQLDENLRLKEAWKKLSVTEQFILEAMVIEEQDANDVLEALKKLNIQINEKIPASDTDRQQLYYFRRKTLKKLSKLLEIT